MALTFEAVLGRKLEDLEDAVIAEAMFTRFKYRAEDDSRQDVEDAARDDLNGLTNTELLSALSRGLENLREARKEAKLQRTKNGKPKI